MSDEFSSYFVLPYLPHPVSFQDLLITFLLITLISIISTIFCSWDHPLVPVIVLLVQTFIISYLNKYSSCSGTAYRVLPDGDLKYKDLILNQRARDVTQQ